ncbi:ABC transporter ATP-binding protein [Enterobacter bugandensis]
MNKFRTKLQLVVYSVALLLRTSPILSCIFLLLITLQGLMPTFSVLASIRFGNIISSSDHHALTITAIMWALTFVIPGILAPVISTLQSVLNSKATYLTQRKIMEAACRIDNIKLLESSDIHDNLEVLSREAAHRPLNLLVNLVDIFRGSLTLLSLSLVLGSVIWWLPLAFLLPLIPVTFAVAYSQMDIFRAMLGKGLASRLIKYYISVLLDVKLAKEIRLFNLGCFFMEKHKKSFNELEIELNKVRRRQLMRPQPWNLLYLASTLGVMYWFVEYITTGGVSIGGLLGIIQSISYFGLSCQWMVYSFASIGVCFDFFARLKMLESIAIKPLRDSMIKVPSTINEIIFENVSFAYEEGHDVLSNINFTLKQNEHLAIVGENGAGKSTLVKLLCGLYQPTSGRIICNGIDISHLDPDEWRHKITAIFQDFGHYNLTVRENVIFSSVPDGKSDSGFRNACEQAHFPLNQGIEENTLIGREYNGTDLSGGEWQRLALARAIYSGGELIVFDEPTSAMDPRVESEIFSHFSNLIKGKTSVIVTHRLGVVKYATNIIVLKNGIIIEKGTPESLAKEKGEYYQLLRLQKEQYIYDD